MTGHTLAASAIEAAREEASDQWRDALFVAPEGWTLASFDLTPVLKPFRVTVLPDWELLVFSGRWGRDGEGRVLAVPADAAADIRRRLSHDLEDYDDDDPPEVSEAAVDLGEALSGDRTDEGLLMASMAVRELGEVGAAGHGFDWLDEHVVDGSGSLPAIRPEWEAPGDVEAWTWLTEPVLDWSPSVDDNGPDPAVTFYTYRSLGGHRISRQTDCYGPAGLAATRTTTTVAQAPGGIIT